MHLILFNMNNQFLNINLVIMGVDFGYEKSMEELIKTLIICLKKLW